MHTSYLRRILIVMLVSVAAGVAGATGGSAVADPDKPTPPRPHTQGWDIGAEHEQRNPAQQERPERTPQAATNTGSNAAPGQNGCHYPWENVVDLGGCGGLYNSPEQARTPRVTPEELLQRALEDVRLPVPQIRTAPPRGTQGVVGLPHWFWLDPDQSGSITERAEAGPVWVELTARPQEIAIDPGDGQTVTCSGGGTPYSRGASASSGCTHTYTASSARQEGDAYTVRATVRWGGTWQGSGGAGGDLTPISRSTTFSLRVAEGQAVVSGGRR